MGYEEFVSLFGNRTVVVESTDITCRNRMHCVFIGGSSGPLTNRSMGHPFLETPPNRRVSTEEFFGESFWREEL